MPRALALPLDAESARALRIGDEVLVSGRAITAREAAHRRLLAAPDEGVRRAARGGAVYHCGPVVAQDPITKAWRFVAAGPSPSAGLEPWGADLVERYAVRAILGKGGMGARTLAALRAHGAVYLHAAAGLGVALARHVVKVHAVHGLAALGPADAIWEIELESFPAIVAMDARGGSLLSRAPAPAAPGAGLTPEGP